MRSRRSVGDSQYGSSHVLDIIFLALTLALFLLGAGYAVLCDRL